MVQDRTTQHLSITVASLTRRRPGMVETLLKSWAAMALPSNTTVRCLIVENDDTAQVQELVAHHDPLPNGVPLDYVLETDPGIPFGRNRAAKEAIAHNSDLLAFVDDDETVAQDWLVRLVAGYRQSEAVLLGAPLRMADPIDGLNRLELMMHNSISDGYRQKEKRNASLTTLNEAPRVTIATNNWIAETRLFSEEGFWFNEEMRFTGGTDSVFCAKVKEAGHKVGWVKDAFVYETLPRDRLRFSYQYARARDQINVHFHRKMEASPISRYALVLRLPGKLIEIIILLIKLPFTGGKTLLNLARTTGWIAGRVGAAFGVRSKLYTNITGG
jgi:GT2 family glycosyltransferase